MNLILMIKGYMPVVVRLENREEYYSVLNQSDTNNIEPLAVFILKNLIDSLRLTIKGAKGESIEEQDDWQKELSLLQLAMQNNNGSNPIQKSKALILKLYEVSFRSLFLRFFEKMTSFQAFFERFEMITSLNETPSVSNTPILNFDENLSKQENIVSMSASCLGKIWKHRQTETSHFRIDLTIEFHDYFYKIKANGVSLEKSYIELIMEEEIDILMQAAGRLGLEKIKKII